jgi:hypothetical protein
MVTSLQIGRVKQQLELHGREEGTDRVEGGAVQCWRRL